MLITNALFRSMHGVATRAKTVGTHLEHHIAVVSKRNKTLIINGRTGSIRYLEASDQLRDDWEPFQPVPQTISKRKGAQENS